jgi:hypothetical protein
MRRRWVGTLGLPLAVALGACNGDRPPTDDTPLDVPGAPGTITDDVDRSPSPQLRPDTLPAEPGDTAPGTGPGTR